MVCAVSSWLLPAHSVMFGGKEAYMVSLNEFIVNNQPKLQEYYKALKVPLPSFFFCARSLLSLLSVWLAVYLSRIHPVSAVLTTYWVLILQERRYSECLLTERIPPPSHTKAGCPRAMC